MVAPDKRTIYPERLLASDGGLELCTDAARDELRAGMAQRSDITVDLWTSELDAKSAYGDTPLYWAQDTHWNSYGMLAAIRSVMDSLDPGVWATDAIVSLASADPHVGDLMRMLGREEPETLPQLTVSRGYQPLEGVPGTLRFGAAGDGPVFPGRTLIVGDSFFEGAVRLLAPWFEDFTFVHINTVVDPEVARQLADRGVDTIVLERVERAAYRTDYVAVLEPLIQELGGGDIADGIASGSTMSP